VSWSVSYLVKLFFFCILLGGGGGGGSVLGGINSGGTALKIGDFGAQIK